MHRQRQEVAKKNGIQHFYHRLSAQYIDQYKAEYVYCISVYGLRCSAIVRCCYCRNGSGKVGAWHGGWGGQNKYTGAELTVT